MLKYKVRREGRQAVPVFAFEDREYALLGEFLLAEARNFGAELLSFLSDCEKASVPAEFAGNAFRVEAAGGGAKVINDITDRECSLPLPELKVLVEKYVELLEE